MNSGYKYQEMENEKRKRVNLSLETTIQMEYLKEVLGISTNKKLIEVLVNGTIEDIRKIEEAERQKEIEQLKKDLL